MQILRALALLAAASSLPGCCYIAVKMCGLPETVVPTRLTRDTPDAAVDYLLDAVDRRAARDLFFALHPDYVRREGDFGLQDFAAGYFEVEEQFRSDADRIRQATRRPRGVSADGTTARIDLEGTVQASLLFRNRPVSWVVLDDPDVPEVPPQGVPPLGSIFEVQEGGLVLLQPLPLGGQGDFVEPARIRRVEIHDDWLLDGIEVAEGSGLAIVEYVRGMKGSKP